MYQASKRRGRRIKAGCISARPKAGGFTSGGMEGLKTLVLPVTQASGLPSLPPDGILPQGRVNMEALKGAKMLDGPVTPGPTQEISATAREEVHRNLYRVPLR